MANESSSKLSRRGFGAVLAASSAAFAQQQSQTGAPNPNTVVQNEQNARRQRPPDVPPFDLPIEFTRADQPPKAEPFPMKQVKVTGAIYKDAADWNRGYMERLTADRLLYNFRENAGLPTLGAKPLYDPDAPRYQGVSWEHPNDGTRSTELRGHFTGHFLSALAQLAASGDADAKKKGDYMVAELAKCQEKLGGGYLSAFPTEFFDRLDRLSPLNPNAPRDTSGKGRPWAPFYTIHKIFAGMLDQYQLAGNQQALDIAKGMGDWADAWTASKTPSHMQDILDDEYGGMGESLYNLAAITNNPKYAVAGDRFIKKWFFNMMGMRNDSLHRSPIDGQVIHANTHIPQVIAAARRYELSGDMRFHDVADFFFHEVADARSYVTTGTSTGERWDAEPRRMAKEFRNYGSATGECCCSYNMMKLARHLYSWTGDPRYFDYYERALLNIRIGTIQPQTGHTQYYLSLTSGAYKTFNSEDNNFWCCTGSGVEEYSKLNNSIYWRDAEGVYVNLYIPSELNWAEKGFRLRQDTKFPEQQGTALIVSADKPVKLSMRLRIPSWLKTGPTVKVNGVALEATASPGSYLTLNRTWKNGDKVEMELPMHLTVEKMPDDATLQAFLYGPLVLAGDFGGEGLTEALMTGVNSPRISRPNARANPNAAGRAGMPSPPPPLEVPALKAAAADPSTWIKPSEKPLTFRMVGQSKDITLAPLNSLFNKRYVVYWTVA